MAESSLLLRKNLPRRQPLGAALLFAGMLLLLGVPPRNAVAQDAVCVPSLLEAPPLHDVAEADIEHIRLELDVDPDRPPATGRAVLTLRTIDANAESVRLVTPGATIDQVFSRDLDESLPFRTVSRDTIEVDLRALRDSLLVARESLSLEFTLTDVAGVQFVDGFAWTIDPLLLGGAWYPWSGAPADRFTSELLVTVTGETLVSASGRRLAERGTEDDRTTFLFSTSEPHAAPALLFAAGPFVTARPPGRVDMYHPGSMETRPDELARGALHTFETGLDYPYPYGRLSLVVVPGAAPVVAGRGILLLSDNTVGVLGSATPRQAAAEIARGVASQWFGGVVSPANWDDVWLTPALSTYLAAIFLEDAYGESHFNAQMRDLAEEYYAEAHQYRRPITWSAAEHPADLYDAHVRGRATWAAHSLRRSIGLGPFWKTMGLLLSRNQFGTVTTDDLGRAVEAVTSTPHDLFIDQWIHAAGHPELASSYSSDRDTLFVTIEQQQVGADVPEVYELNLRIEVGTLFGSERFDVRLHELRQTFALPLSSEARYVAIDPEARYLMDEAVEQSLSAWIAQLRSASTPHARLSATRAVARRRGDPAVLIGLRSALTQETNPFVKAAILRIITELSESEAAQRAILSVYEDTSSVARAAALAALASYPGSEQVERLALEAANSDPVNAVQAAAVELLGRIGSGDALAVAQAALITPSQNAVIRRAGLRVLGMPTMEAEKVDAVALQAATTYSQSEHPLVVRLEAIALLERMAPRVRRAENLLLGMLRASDWQLRLAAADALFRIGNDAAVRAHLGDEPIGWLRTHLARTLACS